MKFVVNDLLQFMQMSANPQMAPFVKYDYILREIAASMDLDEDKILNDKREAMIQAKLMAQMQSLYKHLKLKVVNHQFHQNKHQHLIHKVYW